MSDPRKKSTFRSVLGEIRNVQGLSEREEQTDEDFSRSFNYESNNRSISIGYLGYYKENEEECWFEIDFYEDRQIQESKTFDSQEEVEEFIRDHLLHKLES